MGLRALQQNLFWVPFAISVYHCYRGPEILQTDPIDNVWSVLKSIVYVSPNATVAILKANIQKVWTEHSRLQGTVRACIDSMPKWIEAVIRAKGGLTKYWLKYILSLSFYNSI